LNGGWLGVHLYHISEDAQYKNQLPPGADAPPVRFTPMGLNLFYQLSANTGESEANVYQAQLLFGLAVKTLHDHPSLTDATEINGTHIFEEDCEPLRNSDNRIRLSLQTIPHNEAVSFWTAGSTSQRVAAYYQASVILLEPEESQARSTRVLRYGVHTFVTGSPRLDGSENTLTFSVPDTLESRQLRLRPAEAPPGSAEDSRVIFTGVDLAGEETHLLLRSARWTRARQADASWAIVASANRVVARVRETVGDETVLPGMYAAAVRVVRHRNMPDGSVRLFEQTSNETPFTIAPRIDDPMDGPDAEGIVTIRGHIFQHDDLDPDEDLHVYLGAERLQRRATGTPEPMEFRVTQVTEEPPNFSMELRLPRGLSPGTQIPFRLVINGAESAPRWIEVPA
jgi:hypothetical protein